MFFFIGSLPVCRKEAGNHNTNNNAVDEFKNKINKSLHEKMSEEVWHEIWDKKKMIVETSQMKKHFLNIFILK